MAELNIFQNTKIVTQAKKSEDKIIKLFLNDFLKDLLEGIKATQQHVNVFVSNIKVLDIMNKVESIPNYFNIDWSTLKVNEINIKKQGLPVTVNSVKSFSDSSRPAYAIKVSLSYKYSFTKYIDYTDDIPSDLNLGQTIMKYLLQANKARTQRVTTAYVYFANGIQLKTFLQDEDKDPQKDIIYGEHEITTAPIMPIDILSDMYE